MKKLRLILLLMLGMVVSMQAQDITGKWKCSKGALEQLGSHYKYLRGHCRFKDDGTFKVKLHSTREVPSEYSVYIRVKGTYTMEDGMITTRVERDGVYCNVPNDMPDPYIEPKKRLNEGYRRAENWDERKI